MNKNKPTYILLKRLVCIEIFIFISLIVFILLFNSDLIAAEIRVNAGGGDYRDTSGNLWSADFGFNTGDLDNTTSAIAGTSDDPLYQQGRWDPSASPELEYIFTVADGEYIVDLHFADTWSGTFGVGLRLFDIVIEGVLVENDLDIYAEVGSNTALVKTFNVTVTDGQLNIRFLHVKENTKINAIEIRNAVPDTEAPSMPTGLSGTAASSIQIDLTWSESNDTGGSGLAGYNVYRDGALIATPLDTFYSITGLSAATEYVFTVSAYDNAGNESVQSSPVAVTTLFYNAETIRIMPMGDSITYDTYADDPRPPGMRTGYRQPLWLQFINDGYDVDFVGSQFAGQDATPAFDPHNAGFPGITAAQLAILLTTGYWDNYGNGQEVSPGPYLDSYPSDIIL